MNTTVTRQDLQLQLQQTINTILSRTMSRDEFSNIVLNITQRMCTKQDAQNYIDCAKQKMLERLAVPNGDQLAFNQQIFAQLDTINKILARVELKLDSVQKTVSVMHTENKTVMGRNQTNPARTVLEQLYA